MGDTDDILDLRGIECLFKEYVSGLREKPEGRDERVGNGEPAGELDDVGMLEVEMLEELGMLEPKALIAAGYREAVSALVIPRDAAREVSVSTWMPSSPRWRSGIIRSFGVLATA